MPLSGLNRKFETSRTRELRAGVLNEHDENTISNIEKFGCSVVSVTSNGGRAFGWSYTIGVYDTCGKPDLIAAGLDPKVAQYCLNEAVKRQRNGVDLAVGRQRELIGDVECEFRPVDPKWVKHLMNWANWYYNGADYPVLQAVYPDLQNRFPGDDSFNTHFEQPLMQPGATMTRVDIDFWASQDPKSSLFNWRFSDPPHSGAYISKAVHSGEEPITFVSHDRDDGAWQFLGDTMTESGGVLVCLHHPIDSDPSLLGLADLPLGWFAEREKPGGPWVRNEYEPEASEGERKTSE
jgi:Domain of unknown function (DUF4262)